MHIVTHIRLATLVYDELSRYEDINLDKKWFIYGNIEPDFSPEKKCFKHYEDVATKMIQEIMDGMKGYYITKKEYSLQLGNLCHFICDLFCLYHRSEYMNENAIQHFFYEFNLHRFLEKKWIKEKSFYSEKYDFDLKTIIMDTAPFEIIQSLRSYYTLQSNSFDKDIYYAFSVMKILVQIYKKNMIALQPMFIGLSDKKVKGNI